MSSPSEREPESYADSPMRLQGSSASSASVASRLYGTRSRRDSLGSSSESDLIAFNNDFENMNDLSNQLTSFTKRLSELEERNMSTSEERSRLKTDNAVLNERIHVLEEQLQITEQRYKEQQQDEKTRTKDLIVRMEREKQLEAESLTLKYQMLEKDLQGARRDAERANDETRKARSELEKAKDELAESQLLVEGLEDERIRLEREFRRYKEEAQQDIDSSSEMVEVLTQQTEELRRKAVPRQGSIAEQMVQMEDELEQLRTAVRDLNRERGELQEQLLAESVERGRSLLADAPSLADELAGGDSSQLLEALREQEICNQKLRVYINGILMRVIERHPDILEIGEKEADARPQ